MKNHWLNKDDEEDEIILIGREEITFIGSKGIKTTITKSNVVEFHMARAVHFWIQDQGEHIDKFHIALDRLCTIRLVLREAKEEAEIKWMKMKEEHD